jgi:hypothetical protein
MPLPTSDDLMQEVWYGEIGLGDVAFWRGTSRYCPWKDVAKFFRDNAAVNIDAHPDNAPDRALRA